MEGKGKGKKKMNLWPEPLNSHPTVRGKEADVGPTRPARERPWEVRHKDEVPSIKEGRGLINIGLTKDHLRQRWIIPAKCKGGKSTNGAQPPDKWSVWTGPAAGFWGPLGNEPQMNSEEELYLLNNTRGGGIAHFHLVVGRKPRKLIQLSAVLVRVPEIGEEILADYELVEKQPKRPKCPPWRRRPKPKRERRPTKPVVGGMQVYETKPKNDRLKTEGKLIVEFDEGKVARYKKAVRSGAPPEWISENGEWRKRDRRLWLLQ